MREKGQIFLFISLALGVTLAFGFSTTQQFDFYDETEREGKSMLQGLGLGVPIASSDCRGSTGNGTCVSTQACKNRGGKRLGTCAGGFGACCMLVANCTGGGSCPIKYNGTRIVLNEQNQGSFQYVITKPRSVNQVRLDFLETTFENPDAAGDCTMDRLSITGSLTVNSLVVCGNMSHQHMYLDFGDADRITLNLRKRQTDKKYNVDIRTTFIANQYRKVPSHCLQHFTDAEETIRSFGFPYQLNNQRYTICIESSANSDKIDYTTCDKDPSNSFVVSEDPGVPATPILERVCNKDYIQIFGENRLCGTTFPMKVTTSVRPFMVHVNFNEQEFIEPGLTLKSAATVDNCAQYFCYVTIPGFDKPPKCQYQPDPSCPPDADNEGDVMNSGFCLKFNRS